MPNGGAPGVPPGTEASAAGVSLGEFALLDVDRRRRTGVPEVVFGEGKTSEQIIEAFKTFNARVRVKHPNVPIAFTSITPSPGRWAQAETRKTVNAAIKAYVATQKNLHFIDRLFAWLMP